MTRSQIVQCLATGSRSSEARLPAGRRGARGGRGQQPSHPRPPRLDPPARARGRCTWHRRTATSWRGPIDGHRWQHRPGHLFASGTTVGEKGSRAFRDGSSSPPAEPPGQPVQGIGAQRPPPNRAPGDQEGTPPARPPLAFSYYAYPVCRSTRQLGATASPTRTSTTRWLTRSPGSSSAMTLGATCSPDPTAPATCSNWSSWTSEEMSW